MDAKKKLHIVVILPVLVTMMIVGALLFFVLQAGSGGSKTYGLENMAQGHGAHDSEQHAMAVPGGAPGVAEGYEGSGDSSGDTSGEAGVPEMEAVDCSFSQWVGSDVDETAVQATGRPYRILKPGDMATMDYSPERINVLIDDSGKVMAVRCG